MLDWHSFYFRAGLGFFIGGLLFIHSLWFHFRCSRQEKRVVIARQNNETWRLWFLFGLLFSLLLSPSLSFYKGPAVAFSGLIISLAGLLLTCSARHELGRFWSFRNEITESHRWKSDGLYRIWAHPIYLGELLVSLGGFILSGHVSGFLFMIAVWQINQRRAAAEVRMLTTHLGPRLSEPLAWQFVRQFKIRPYRIVPLAK